MRTATLLPARYRDAELVARGGMGEMYCAVDTSLGRTVAIKVLDERLASDETVRKRFERDYNLAFALAQTQGCSGRVLQLLDASQSIQGHRSEINKLRAKCKKAGA